MESFKILFQKSEELPFEDADLLALIFKICYAILKNNKSVAGAFHAMGLSLISKMVDIISAHQTNPNKIESSIFGVATLSHYL